MKRFALVLGISLFAACGDDGGHNTNTCGDGLKSGSEQCDDGNTTSGDGCSSSCQIEVAPACGDSHIDTGEECDDGNTTNGDGCSSTCQTETAPPRCGDHHTDPGEDCDDGNTANGDGCSSTCHTEPPPVVCGDGMVGTGETCDDGNTTAGDGCSATCAVEMNYTCTGMPSVCTLMPGNGTCALPFDMPLMAVGGTYTGTGTGDTTTGTNQVDIHDCDSETGTGGAGAAKDQLWKFVNPVAQKVVISLNNHIATPNFDGVLRVMTVACDVTTQVPDSATHADGCSDVVGSGTTEVITFNSLAAGTYYVLVDGFTATSAGMYSLSIAAGTATCGNNVVEPGEGCDDHNTTAGDGCSATCAVETGYTCAGSPSVCTLNCGNGTIQTGETCDDMNTTAGDGCNATCGVETGWTCTGAPSACTHTCGNGTLDAGETCDDHNSTAGDGCDSACHVETGYTCSGTPSVCVAACGNGVIDSGETCDDGNHTAGDGCGATCRVETGYACTGTPSTCVNTGGTCAAPYTVTLTASGTAYTAVAASDDTNSTNQVAADACEDESSAGAGFDHQWKLVNPVTQPVKITLVGAQTPFDGVIRLMTTACDVSTQVPDDDTDGEPDGCSDKSGSGGTEVLTYSSLPAGTYYIDIDGYGTAGQGPYMFTIAAGAQCGNGDIEGSEECDGGPTTNMYCSATCTLLSDTTDTEPNNTGATAQVITPVHHIIKGSLPMDDLDVYSFTLTAASVVKIETYTTYEGNYENTNADGVPHLSCPTGTADTEVSLFTTAASVSATDPTSDTVHDDDDGDLACSYLMSATLAAGTYYFTVHDYNGQSSPLPLDPIARYLVDFSVTP